MSVLQTVAGFNSNSSGVDIGDSISNSLMLDSGAGQHLSKAFALGDRKTWCVNVKLKRGKLGTGQTIFCGPSGVPFFYFQFNTSDQLEVGQTGGASAAWNSTRTFRDPGAFLDITLAFDTTSGTTTMAGTSTDRLRLYEKQDQLVLTGGTVPTYNTDYQINNNTTHYIGSRYAGSAYGDFYIASFRFIGGLALSPSDFNRISADTLQVVNKTYAGSYSGTNSCHLDFANSADLGNDVSGNNNDWTLNGGISSASQYTDTPTNNYAVLNPLFISGGRAYISRGNLRQGADADYGYRASIVSMPIPDVSSCDLYVEFTNVTNGTPYNNVAVCKSTNANLAAGLGAIYGVATGFGTDSRGYWGHEGTLYNGGSIITAWSTNGTVLGLRIYNGGLYWYVNGTAVTGNPITTGLTGEYYIAVNTCSATGKLDVNLGQLPYAYPVQGTNANKLCTANLPTPAVPKASAGFVASATAESALYAQVAADVSGWAGYVQIMKNRSSVESWIWTFSHNATREYAVSAGAATDQAVRAMSGSDNWIGYSIRIGATYGTAAGSVSHTNGADTTVTTGVTLSTRQMIFLFLRGSGTVVRIYHPDLTAGKLLDLCSFAAETTSATIKTVTATTFKIDTGTATGTYDYLIVSDIEGFCKVFSYTGNAALDGTFANLGVKPRGWMIKSVAALDIYMMDTARDNYNVANKYVRNNNNLAESTATYAAMDANSNGLKMRIATGEVNDATLHVGFTFAEAPTKYATAR